MTNLTNEIIEELRKAASYLPGHTITQVLGVCGVDVRAGRYTNLMTDTEVFNALRGFNSIHESKDRAVSRKVS